MLLDLAAQRRVLFIGGKGGVGKTAIASTIGLHQARAGRRVLVVSTDPAHNLGHLWERSVGDDLVELWSSASSCPESQSSGTAHPDPGVLHGVEIDPRRTIETHLAEVGETLRDFMPPHLHPQVDRHLQLSAQSPGTHEAAVLERIAVLMEYALDSHDLLIFDTAPSGHTARLMTLPEIMSAWTEGLLDRRTKAERFGAAIRALDGDDDPAGTTGENRDRRIRQVLSRRKARFEMMRRSLTDAQECSFVIVLTAERLPVLESAELHAHLEETGVDVGGLVVNRVSPTDAGEFLAERRRQEERHLISLREILPGAPVDTLPMLPGDLVGPSALQKLAEHLR